MIDSVQETIEKTLRKEVQKFKKIALSQREIIRNWAPQMLSKDDRKVKRSSSSVSTSSYRDRAPPSSPTRSMRSSQSPSTVRDERSKQHELYERERYIIPDKYAPSSPARPRSPPKDTIRLSSGSLSHGTDFRPTGGNAKIPEVPPPLPPSPYKYHEVKPHKEITPAKVRQTRSPTRKSLNTSTERSISDVMREAEELIAATKIKSKTKSKSSSLSPAPSKTKKTSTKRRSKSTSSVNRSLTSIDSIKESKPTKKTSKPKKKKTKSVTAMALKREVNKILKEIANETN